MIAQNHDFLKVKNFLIKLTVLLVGPWTLSLPKSATISGENIVTQVTSSFSGFICKLTLISISEFIVNNFLQRDEHDKILVAPETCNGYLQTLLLHIEKAFLLTFKISGQQMILYTEGAALSNYWISIISVYL